MTQSALTLPALRAGPLPLPQCGSGALLFRATCSPSPALRERVPNVSEAGEGAPRGASR